MIDRCAGGDRRAQRVLMTRVLPVVRMQVSLLLRHMGGPRAISADRQDLCQDVLVELFRKGAQELRRWDPEAGLSLEGFVRLVARRFVARRICRQGKRYERFLATAPDALDAVSPPPQDDEVERRDQLDAVLGELHAQMSPRDQVLFMRLFVEQQPSAAVAQELGMSIDALKKWRSRMYARVDRIATRLRSEGASVPRMSPSAIADPRGS